LNHMALAQTPLTGSPDPTFSQDLSGLGHKFELIGTAADAADPRNPTNDVIALKAGSKASQTTRDATELISVVRMDDKGGAALCIPLCRIHNPIGKRIAGYVAPYLVNESFSGRFHFFSFQS